MARLDEVFERVDFKNEIESRLESTKKDPKRISEMLEMQVLEYNPKERTVTFEMPVYEWQTNAKDILHGGISATMIDFALGVYANMICIELGGYFAPTASMNINYLLPITMGKSVVITAKLVSTGSSLLIVNGELRVKGSEELAITATVTYKVMKI